MRGRPSGAVRIFLYNWPVYVSTWGGAATACIAAWLLPDLAEVVAWLAGGAVLWSAISLGISSYVYDRSPLAGGAWVPDMLGSPAPAWATVHAGLDAEIDLGALGPEGCVARLDIFDPSVMHAPSIRRARRTTAPRSPSIPSRTAPLALGDEACDAIVVAFTAHEIRQVQAREAFFIEIRRCLRAGGRALLVEHLRDVPNFVAFGPGFFHFLPRREWLRLAERARLAVIDERRITPWVMAMTLQRDS